MKKISINILYWDNNEKDRLENTNLAWKYLKEFCEYARNNGVNIEEKIYDFSEEKVLDEAVHIPYPKGEYKRAEKINKVLELSKDSDIFSIMDSDIAIKPTQHKDLVDVLKCFNPKKFYVVNVDDVIDRTAIENGEIVWENIFGIKRKMDPDGGGLLFIDTAKTIELGGYDERFICWGGEENEFAKRAKLSGLKKTVIPFNLVHLPHKSVAPETFNTEQYQKQVNILMGK